MKKFFTEREYNRIEGLTIAAAASAMTTNDWALAVILVVLGTVISYAASEDK